MRYQTLRAMVEVNAKVMHARAEQEGALQMYKPTNHFNLLPADYEQVVNEKYPSNTWTSPGRHPAESNRFAQYNLDNCTLQISTRHDYTKE